MNIVKYTPQTQADRFFNTDQFFNDFWPWASFENSKALSEQVKVNVVENKDNYTLTAEVPGLKEKDIDIEIKQPEYTSVCPMTGLPDFGCIIIKYRPNQKIIELKSLKYYLLQYRNVGIFYEHVVNRILDDLVSVLDPKQMEVTGDFTARGGIISRVSATYEEK